MHALELHNIITKSEIIVGEYRILNHLLTYDYPASKKNRKLEKYNPKVALTVLNVDLDVKVFKYNDQEYADINKPIKQACVLNIILKEKKRWQGVTRQKSTKRILLILMILIIVKIIIKNAKEPISYEDFDYDLMEN